MMRGRGGKMVCKSEMSKSDVGGWQEDENWWMAKGIQATSFSKTYRTASLLNAGPISAATSAHFALRLGSTRRRRSFRSVSVFHGPDMMRKVEVMDVVG
jgi:hypothetical protein